MDHAHPSLSGSILLFGPAMEPETFQRGYEDELSTETSAYFSQEMSKEMNHRNI